MGVEAGRAHDRALPASCFLETDTAEVCLSKAKVMANLVHHGALNQLHQMITIACHAQKRRAK